MPSERTHQAIGATTNRLDAYPGCRARFESARVSWGSLQQILNSFAVVVPDWLKMKVPANWTERYVTRWEDYRLPKTEAERLALAEQVGRDGLWLMTAVFGSGSPTWLRQSPAVQTLRQIRIRNFYQTDGAVH